MNENQRIAQQSASHLQLAAKLLLENAGVREGALDPLMSAREQADYDKRKLLRGLIDPSARGDARLEFDVDVRAIKEGLARGAGACVPYSVMVRDVNATGATTGGPLVGTHTSIDAAAWLRPVSACVAAGATVVAGVGGKLSLPYLASGATAGIAAEGAATSATNHTTGLLTLGGYSVTAHVPFSKQLNIQSPESLDILVADLHAAVAGVIDRVAINGSGTGEPLGVLGYSGIGNLALGAAGGYASSDDIAKLEEIVEQANGTLGPMGFVTSPKIKRGLRKFGTNGETPIWQRVQGQDYLAGTPAWASTNVPVNLTKGASTDCSPIIYGRWSEMFILLAGAGIEISVDPVTLADQGKNRLMVHLLMDVGVRLQSCFAAIKDSRIPA